MGEQKEPRLTDKPHFRVGVVLLTVLALFVIVRMLFIPPSFGEYGYYRGDNVDEWAALPVSYAASGDCAMCHSPVAETLASYEHKNLDCQSCHSAAAEHTQDPSTWQPSVENPDRDFCLACHRQIEGRSEEMVRQVDPEEHNPDLTCITCHGPHEPWSMLGGKPK